MKLFIADLVCAFILSVCDLLYPMITRKMMYTYIPEGMMKAVLICAGVLAVAYVIKWRLNYFVGYYGHIVGVRMQYDMRREVFEHLQKLPLSYFDENKTGTIMSRIITDLFDISELAHHGPEDLFISLIILIGAFVALSMIYLPLALIVFAVIPIMVIYAARLRVEMGRTSKASRVVIGEINASLENSIAGIKVSKAYTNEEDELERFTDGNRAFVRQRSKYYKVMARFISGTALTGDVLNICLALAGGLFCLYGKITVIDFTAFIMYVNIFMTPVKKLIGFVEQYQNGMTGFERFCEIMDAEEEKDDPDAEDVEVIRGDIEFDNVSFTYNTYEGDHHSGREILHNLSFTVNAGRKLALVGPSGGGKTTICNLIPRFYDIDSGAVRIDGKDIRKIKIGSLRKAVGIVSQDVFLFDSTIYDNISYGCPGASREDVMAAAEKAGILNWISGLEDGLDTIVGERGVRLSGGQKQRIAIARVFLKDPPILILDEATSALDNVTEAEVSKSLSELSRGRTTISVAHRLTTVKGADEILVITDEGIAERGTHEELLKKGGTYSTLWNTAF